MNALLKLKKIRLNLKSKTMFPFSFSGLFGSLLGNKAKKRIPQASVQKSHSSGAMSSARSMGGYSSSAQSSSDDFLNPLNPISPFSIYNNDYPSSIEPSSSFDGFDGGSSGGGGASGSWDSGSSSSSDSSSSYDSGSSSDSSSSCNSSSYD